METIDGFSKFDNVRRVVYKYKSQFDRKSFLFDEEYASAAYDKFMRENRNNLTVATAAMRESLREEPLTYPNSFKKNLAKLKNDPAMRYLLTHTEEHLKSLYPKTLKARMMLIAHDRVTLSNEVLPKAKGIEKTLLKLFLRF